MYKITQHSGGSRISQTVGGGGSGDNPEFGMTIYYYCPHWSWGKVMILQVSVILLRGKVCSGGGCAPGGVLQGVPGPREFCLGGVPGPRGVPVPGGPGGDPPGRPLLRAVRILLECILVWQDFCWILHKNESNWTERGLHPYRPRLVPSMHTISRINNCNKSYI